MGCSSAFWIPNAEQSSSTNVEVKFAPLLLSNLAGMPNIEINLSYSSRATVLLSDP